MGPIKEERAVFGNAISKASSQIAYNHLKESIINDKIEAGKILNGMKIADLFEVSLISEEKGKRMTLKGG